MENERAASITICDKEYELVLTTGATKQIAKRYGGLANLGDKLMKAENFENALDELIWLIALLANQSILIHNFQHPEDKRDLLTEETIELLTSPHELVKYLASNFGKVYYNSYEEGLSLSIMEAYRRVRMDDLKASSVMMVREEYEELIERLQRPASPRFVFIDSIQFLDLTVPQYKKLKELFPTKVFVFVSHMEGIGLQGATAKKIEKDASILMKVDHFRMIATGRYGGGEPYTINEERAKKYWGEL